MLLTYDCLPCRIIDDKILPIWLGAGDAAFIDTLLDRVQVLDGLSVSEVGIAGVAICDSIARDAEVPTKLAEAVWSIERRRWESKVDAPIDPEALRDVLFELAARMSADKAIAKAAEAFAIFPALVAGTLFADRPGRRRIYAPRERSRTEDVIARYNLALAQSLLARSMSVEATIVGDPALIIAAAKRDGLVARFETGPDSETTKLSLIGPLAIFHNTSKYGRSLARFVPALVAMKKWSLRARVTLGPRSGELELDQLGSISFAAALPAEPDGRLARKVAYALRGVGCRVDLHPPVIRLPAEPARALDASVVIPDFALVWNGRRVLVDIIPFATPEFLACKIEVAKRVPEPMMLCVHERYAEMEGRGYSWLMTYRDEIDAWKLFERARALIEEPTTSSTTSFSEPSSSLPSPSPSPSVSTLSSEPASSLPEPLPSPSSLPEPLPSSSAAVPDPPPRRRRVGRRRPAPS